MRLGSSSSALLRLNFARPDLKQRVRLGYLYTAPTAMTRRTTQLELCQKMLPLVVQLTNSAKDLNLLGVRNAAGPAVRGRPWTHGLGHIAVTKLPGISASTTGLKVLQT